MKQLTNDEDPRQWNNKKKWRNVLLISFQATLTPIASTLLAVGSIAVAEDFKLTNTYVISLPTALFVLGNGLGPLYLAPLSELYGRRIVYIYSFTLFAAFNLGCALSPNITALSIFRLFSGMAGSAASSLSGASVGDMFIREERGRAQALYAAAPILGPVIGGVCGGFIVSGTGTWRWLMWIVVIAPAVTVFLCIFFLRETYGPVILKRKQRSNLPNNTFPKRPQLGELNPSPRQLFVRAITRPIRLLLFAPLCSILSLYVAL